MDHQVEDLRRQITDLRTGWTTLDTVIRGGNGSEGMVATLARMEVQQEARGEAMGAMSERITQMGDGLQLQIGNLRADLQAQITTVDTTLRGISRQMDEQAQIEQGMLQERQRIAKWLKVGASLAGVLLLGGGVSVATMLTRLGDLVAALP
jgi:hypothetical protein